jgi:hypothetical protein
VSAGQGFQGGDGLPELVPGIVPAVTLHAHHAQAGVGLPQHFLIPEVAGVFPGQALADRQGGAVGGLRLVQALGTPVHLAQALVAVGHPGLKTGERGIEADQPLTSGQGFPVEFFGLIRVPAFEDQVAQVVVAGGQVVLMVAVAGVGAGQWLPERQRRTGFCLRPGPVAGLVVQRAQV